MSRPTAVVIGAGPAGLSAAIGLQRSGFDVVLLEQIPKIKSRVCGAFLNPEAVRHLEWLGVREQAESEGIAVRHCQLTASFIPTASVPIKQRGREGIGLPRVRLEEMLLKKFLEEGGRFESGTKIKSLDLAPKADWTVLADGRFSLAQGDAHKAQNGGWYGWNALFLNARQDPGGLSLHFYPGGYVGTLTFKDGLTNVCGLLYRHRSQPLLSWENIFSEAIAAQPHLKAMLADARRETEWRGVGPLPHTTGLRPSGDFVLVGDAAAVGDPFMGEGIGRSLGAGPMLYKAVAQSGGAAVFDARKTKTVYEHLWKKYYTSRLRLGSVTRAVIRRRWLFRPTVSFLLKIKAPLVYTRLSHAGFEP